MGAEATVVLAFASHPVCAIWAQLCPSSFLGLVWEWGAAVVVEGTSRPRLVWTDGSQRLKVRSGRRRSLSTPALGHHTAEWPSPCDPSCGGACQRGWWWVGLLGEAISPMLGEHYQAPVFTHQLTDLHSWRIIGEQAGVSERFDIQKCFQNHQKASLQCRLKALYCAFLMRTSYLDEDTKAPRDQDLCLVTQCPLPDPCGYPLYITACLCPQRSTCT